MVSAGSSACSVEGCCLSPAQRMAPPREPALPQLQQLAVAKAELALQRGEPQAKGLEGQRLFSSSEGQQGFRPAKRMIDFLVKSSARLQHSRLSNRTLSSGRAMHQSAVTDCSTAMFTRTSELHCADIEMVHAS